MVLLSEIAFRRLDGIYFEETRVQRGSAPSFAHRYLVGLLGYELTPEAQAAFESVSEISREQAFVALQSKLNHSQIRRIRKKAEEIKTASEYNRLLLDGKDKLKLLKLVSKDELQGVFERLITQPLPYSEQDRLDLIELAELFPVGDLQAAARENNAVLAGLIEGYDWTRSMTVTDALRVAAVWSNGDQTLEVAPRFKLKRSQRRAIALALESVLEKSDYALFDFARHRELWKRLFTALRVSDYRVPKLQAAAHMLFEDQLLSMDALIEHLIKESDFDGLLVHLRTMPGVFARRLHELIRKMPDRRAEIVEAFSDEAHRVSTRVLVQLRNYFAGPDINEAPNLPFAGKSRTARNGLIENRKRGDYSDVTSAVDSALSSKLMGKKVYIGDQADKIGVMTSNRSSALGSRVVAPGSRLALPSDAKFLTLFTHWKDMDGDEGGYSNTVDLDLSGLFLSEDLQRSEHLAYYSTSSEHARYSGDITSAPNGAEEYIAVDVKHARARGFRYMAIVVNSYSGQKISTIPECYAGIATAKSLKFRDFDAASVEARFDLTAAGREVIPLLLDLETLELIWVDMAFAGARSGANMQGSTDLGSVLSYIINFRGLTVGDLVEKSGAVRVDSVDEADLVIDPRMSDQVAQLLE